MAAVRLTNYIRTEISNALLKHKFQEPVEKLLKKKAAFALKVYNDVFSEKDRKLMDNLPEGWMRQDKDIAVQFGAVSPLYARLRFKGDDGINYETLKFAVDKPEDIYRKFPYIENSA